MSSEVLLNIGFVDVGMWVVDGENIAYRLDGLDADALQIKLDNPGALYAFVRGNAVQYIGKTTRSIRRRFVGYCRPGTSQSTNLRCHGKIKQVLADGGEIRIFIFIPITHLRYAEFEISLAAGLEDSLIREFTPPWNGRDHGEPITEEAEREREGENGQVQVSGNGLCENDTRVHSGLASFTISLGQAYYDVGLINPGVEASRCLGRDGDPIKISFGDGSPPVISSINRTANASGSVRVVGNNRQIARWFQKHFQKGDIVQARVVDAHHIFLAK